MQKYVPNICERLREKVEKYISNNFNKFIISL